MDPTEQSGAVEVSVGYLSFGSNYFKNAGYASVKSRKISSRENPAERWWRSPDGSVRRANHLLGNPFLLGLESPHKRDTLKI